MVVEVPEGISRETADKPERRDMGGDFSSSGSPPRGTGRKIAFPLIQCKQPGALKQGPLLCGFLQMDLET